MKTKDLAYIALFAAITAVLGLVPAVQVVPVPITAQTLGVMLAGSILGARRGFLSQLLFLVLVAVGCRCSPAAGGGLAVFAGPTAGYLISWPIAAFVVGLLTERFWARYNLAWGIVANVVGGIVVIYAIGVPVLKAVAGPALGRRDLVRRRRLHPGRPDQGGHRRRDRRPGAPQLPGDRATAPGGRPPVRLRRESPAPGPIPPAASSSAASGTCYGDRVVLPTSTCT